MNSHDHDPAESQLGAYALGALDLEDRPALEALLSQSPAHQEELRQLREIVALLPYAAPPAIPPDRVRERLFARIAAAQPATRRAAPSPGVTAPRPGPRWLMPGLLAGLAALVLVLSTLTFSLNSSVARLDHANRQLVSSLEDTQQALAETQARQEQLARQLAAGEERIAQISAALARDDYVISFVSAPGVATRQLQPAQAGVAAQGAMYMYPGHSNAVVIFSGLPPLATGQVYQFWFADGTSQVASSTFEVDPTGIGYIVVEAPREVNAFSEVMVTVEPAGGSATPSRTVVLEGSL